jgi:hypothetical protein
MPQLNGPYVADRARSVKFSDSRRLTDPCRRLGTSRPAPPSQGEPGRTPRRSADRTGAPRLRLGWAPRPLAGPLGVLALGSLRSELVTSDAPARSERQAVAERCSPHLRNKSNEQYRATPQP